MASSREFRTRGGRKLRASVDQQAFSLEVAQDLAEICGRSKPDCIAQLRERLNQLASIAGAASHYEQTELSVHGKRVALNTLQRGGRRFLRHIEEADQSVRGAIFSAYREPRHEGDPDNRLDDFLTDVNRLSRLCRGIETALDSLPKKPGPLGVGVLTPLCGDLIGLYEENSGESFTYERSSYKADPETFITAGGSFIALAVLHIFPDATVSNIDTAIRNARKARR